MKLMIQQKMEDDENKKKDKPENLGFIEKFLQLTEGISETNVIYQDIIDDVFEIEMREVTKDNEYIENLLLRRDLYT